MVYRRRRRIFRRKTARRAYPKRYRRYRPRSFRRRRSSRRRGLPLYRHTMNRSSLSIGPFRPIARALLPYDYCQTVVLSGSLLTPVNVVNFRANSLHDPDTQTSGSYNQFASAYKFYSSIYKRYRVDACYMKLTITQASLYTPETADVAGGFATFPYKFIIKLDDDNSFSNYSTAPSWLAWSSDPAAVMGTFRPKLDGSGKCVLRHKFKLKRSCPDYLLAAYRSMSEFGDNPPSPFFFQIIYCKEDVSSFSPAVVGVKVQIAVKMKFYSTFTELNDLGNIGLVTTGAIQFEQDGRPSEPGGKAEGGAAAGAPQIQESIPGIEIESESKKYES